MNTLLSTGEGTLTALNVLPLLKTITVFLDLDPRIHGLRTSIVIFYVLRFLVVVQMLPVASQFMAQRLELSAGLTGH